MNITQKNRTKTFNKTFDSMTKYSINKKECSITELIKHGALFSPQILFMFRCIFRLLSSDHQ